MTEDQFTAVMERLDEMDTKIGDMDGRIGRRFDSLNARITDVESVVRTTERELSGLRRDFGSHSH